jgi:hypothetical protein
MPEMPKFGDPCNGCGFCCIAEQCAVSVGVFGEQELCPALEQGEGRFNCGLMRNAGDYGVGQEWSHDLMTQSFRILLGAGGGCDAGPEATEEQAAQMRAYADKQLEAVPDDVRMLVNLMRGK